MKSKTPFYNRYKQMRYQAGLRNLDFGFQNYEDFAQWCTEKGLQETDRIVRQNITQGFTKENLAVIKRVSI